MKLPKTFILLLLVVTLTFNFTFGSRRKNKKTMSRSDRHGGENSKNNTNNNNLSSSEYLRAFQTKEGGRRERKRNRGDSRGTLRTTEEAKVITQKKFLKEDWCKSRNVRQNIRTTDDCRGKIINKFCYGHCNSFYIPSDIVVPAGDSLIDSADVNQNYFRSCSFCMPAVEEIVTVRLRCKKGRKTKTIRRKMKRTKSCTCVAVPHLANKLPEKTDLASSTTVATTTTTTSGMITDTTAVAATPSSSTVAATDRNTTKGKQSSSSTVR